MTRSLFCLWHARVSEYRASTLLTWSLRAKTRPSWAVSLRRRSTLCGRFGIILPYEAGQEVACAYSGCSRRVGLWNVGFVPRCSISPVRQPVRHERSAIFGALAAPMVYGVIYIILGVVGAFLVALLLSISVAALNELGFFAPWSRLQVRIWALNAALVTTRSKCGRLPFFPRGSFNHQHVFRALSLDSQPRPREARTTTLN